MEIDKILNIVPTYDVDMVKFIPDETFKGYFTASTQNYYALLCSISKLYNNITIYDIGSYTGTSAIALASNPNNKVISYDIVNLTNVIKPDNVTFIIGNFYNDSNILNSPLIYFDIDPHDGIKELEAYTWFINSGYVGIIIWDDIHLNNGMSTFWNSINIEKYDITNLGHQSGTGVTVHRSKNAI